VQGGGSAPARRWGESPTVGIELGAEGAGAKLRRTSDGRVYLQQAAEKYLKGYLLSRGWSLKRTHDLEVLLNEAMNHDGRFQAYLNACIMVREFYVEERYPFIGSPPPSRQELEEAIDAIQEMITLILREIERKSAYLDCNR